MLRDGDIINVDVTPILDGFHGDASRTFLIGDVVAPIARRLVEDTYRSLWRGIAAVRPGGTIGDIGHAIQSFVEPRGYSVVRAVLRPRHRPHLPHRAGRSCTTAGRAPATA